MQLHISPLDPQVVSQQAICAQEDDEDRLAARERL